jgi:hypothetical protein
MIDAKKQLHVSWASRPGAGDNEPPLEFKYFTHVFTTCEGGELREPE